MKCKSAAPETTSCCFLLPAWQGKWRGLLSGMKLLKRYNKGSMLFSVPVDRRKSHSMLGPSPWDMEVWYDAPSPAMQLHSSGNAESLLMTF